MKCSKRIHSTIMKLITSFMNNRTLNDKWTEFNDSIKKNIDLEL